MSTPSNASNAHPLQTKPPGSTGPSTPAATASAGAPAGLSTQSNAGTPRSNPPTMHPSPANHRSPLNIRSPAAARSHGGTPMMRAASANAYSSGHGATPSQRAHAVYGMKGVGTPGKSGTLGGKMPAGSSGLAAGAGLGIVGQSNLPGATPNLNASSPGLGTSPGNNTSLNSLAGFGSPANTASATGASAASLPGAVDMDVSLSGLGFSVGSAMSAMGSSVGGRLDDEERRKRLELVLDMLGQRPGRVSREAVERLGRRYELDMHMDQDELSLAGKNAVMLEILFKPNKSHLVERVAVAFPTASDTLSVHADKASKILQRDLTPSQGTATINASLDKFADNLERLSRLDKLSVVGANCFEAVFGVYTSLRKLFEHEKKLAETILTTKSDSLDIDNEVMCKRSGKPEMHANGRVGLSLQYWRHKRLVPKDDPAPFPESDKMDVDGEKADDRGSAEGDTNSDDIASITVECESSSPALYPSIRITDSWLSERVSGSENAGVNGDHPTESAADGAAKQSDQTAVIEWEDPPPPLIPTVEPDPMSTIASAHQTQPQARFVAKFEPAIILPLEIAARLYASVDVNITQENLVPSTLESLILPSLPANLDSFAHGDPGSSLTEPTQSRMTRRVAAYDSVSELTLHDWDIRLFPTRSESALQIHQVPFSHPRQIVATLPVLRQYCFFTNLVKNTFSASLAQSASEPTKETTDDLRESAKSTFQKAELRTKMKGQSTSGAAANIIALEADFAAFLSEKEQGSEQGSMNHPRTLDISVSLKGTSLDSVSAAPAFRSPHLTINIPGVSLPGTGDKSSKDAVAQISLTILPNADVEIEIHDLQSHDALAPEKTDESMNVDTEAQPEVKMEDNPNSETEQNSSNEIIAEKKARDQKTKDALLQALLICEDLAIWAEWIKSRFPSE